MLVSIWALFFFNKSDDDDDDDDDASPALTFLFYF